MAKVTLKGNPLNTAGDLPKVGSAAPAFTLVRTDLSEVSNKDLAGQRVVLNIFPSLDTPTCAASVRKFNARANEKPNTTILCVSEDLPFAQKRFCGAEGLDNVVPASAFRTPDFGKTYGVTLVDGPMKGLLARAVVVVDGAGKVIHTELVPEIAQEPDYNAALAVL
ncbi:thiol peroxidase [Geothrix fermentans]|jgi:thiol peroxidase|uniref:thiol peroxidase n=1 Tax=Geothrix fermentans TaxID=44676 RepID=UPI0003F9B8EE|nr:thiol peroxidase [Geothrix fermentans]